MSEQQTKPQMLTGIVVSTKRDKTITVKVTRHVAHPKYKKIRKLTGNVHAHAESNSCGLGDRVLIQQCRPISKTKQWKLVEVLEVGAVSI